MQALSQLSYSPKRSDAMVTPGRQEALRVGASARTRSDAPRSYPLRRDGRPPLRPVRDRAPLAEGVGGRAHLGGHQRRRRPTAEVLRARDAPVPQRRAAHRPPEGLLRRRRRRALPSAHGPPRAAPDGLRRVRPARREPRDPHRPASARVDRRGDRLLPAAFREWGISIDWTREFGTHEPRYYRWTQWIFLQLFEHGLAYRKESAVNWGPVDETVLANEQVVDGRCERCGTLVEIRQLEQWFFRITDYADRLLADLDTIEWPEHVKRMQRNWIGRSEGAEVTFRCEELGIDYPVFTTRPDTLFGATFFVLAPEHPDVVRLAAGTAYEQEAHEYINRVVTRTARSAATLTGRRPASSWAAP